VRTPGTQGSERPSRGVRLPFRVRPRARRPLSFSAPSAVLEEDGDLSVSRVRDPPLLVLAPTNTTTPGAPFAALRRDASRWARDCRSLAGAVLRVLAPLDGSGCTSRRSVPLAEHAVGRDAPTLGGLVPCRSRSWSRPSELVPSRRAVPALAGPCFLAGSRSTAAWRDVLEGFTTAFPAAPTLCLGSPSRVHRTVGP